MKCLTQTHARSDTITMGASHQRTIPALRYTGTLFAIAIFVFLACPCALLSQELSQPSGWAQAAQLRNSLRTKLTDLATRCRELDLTSRAEMTQAWSFPRDPNRGYFFLPPVRDPLAPDGQAATVEQQWYAKFREIRNEHAEQLFKLARQLASRPDSEGLAYRLLHETLRANPDHAATRQALGFRGDATAGWQRPADRIRTSRKRTPHPDLGWPRYSVLRSAHFELTTNHSPRDSFEFLEELEELYAVWQQCFYEYWSKSGALAQRLQGHDVSLRSNTPPRFAIVLFQDRQQYVEQLSKIEPRIAQSIGYYLPSRRTAYFYAGDASSRTTRFHEATHQFFQESISSVEEVGASANFWVVEGVALYMESYRRFSDHVTLGGFDAERLQFARYRRLRQNRYLPLSDLVSLGRESLQQRDDLARLYSQIAGLVHFLLDQPEATNHPRMCRYLKELYRGSDSANSLAAAWEIKLETLDQQYVEFLRVDERQLAFLGPDEEVHSLCLVQCPLSAESLRQLSGLTSLDWLDLSFIPAGDEDLRWIANNRSLTQLSLEHTAVTSNFASSLTRLKKLEELDLSGTQVDDRIGEALTEMSSLRALWLTQTRVTAEIIASLNLLRNLEQVELSGTQVPEATFRELQMKLNRRKER